MSEQLFDNQALKQTLLSLLDDNDVQYKIHQITKDSTFEASLETPVAVDGQISHGKEVKHTLEVDEINKLVAEKEEMKRNIEKLKSILELKESALSENNQQISSLNNEKDELEASLSKVTCDFDQNKQSLSAISGKHQILLTEYNSLKDKHEQQERKISYYIESFEEDLRIKEIYDGLSSQTKLSTVNIFKDISIKGLIACGIQEKYIFNLWDYIKTEVVGATNPDQDHLIQFFELLFRRFKLAYSMFELQPVQIGDKFDTQSHIKHNSSMNMSGSIQAILFQGCINTKTGKVIKPSIVVL